MYVKFLLVLSAVFISGCSLAPRNLSTPKVLTGQVTYGEPASSASGAEVIVSRCFLPRSIVPICEFVPLAKYKSNSDGFYEALVYLKGLYRFTAKACIGDKEFYTQEDIEINTGSEQLPKLNLSGSYGAKCSDDI